VAPHSNSATAEAIEGAVHGRWKAGDVDGAAAHALRHYGAEVFGYLLAVHRDEDDARDVFSVVCERFWRTLPRFEWRASLRTYLYVLARSQSARHRRDEARRRARLEPLSEADAVPAEVREATRSCLRSDGPRSITRLRDALQPDDRELLVLRVDRGLAWPCLARVFLGDEADEAAVEREAARLRKRFQLLRRRLLDEGRARGLFPDPAASAGE
jgi:RNA polymerase sigma-70 factor, ECF subfamily